MKLNTGIRALKELFRSKSEKAGPVKTGRTAALSAPLLEADEPDIMYLEETPAIYAIKQKSAAQESTEPQKKEAGDHRYTGRHHDHRLTLHKKTSVFFHRRIDEADETAKNRSRQKQHRIRLFAAYATAGIAIVAGLLIFVLPVGGNAASELIQPQSVVLSDNPRVEQMDIDPSQISQTTEPEESPDAPTVTSTLFDDIEKAAAAANIIDAAEATPTPEPTATPEPVPTIAVDELVEFFIDESGPDYNETGYSTNSFEYTDDEFYLLAQIIDIESRGEPFEGMVAVGNVVMNRVLNTETFGNTISSVVKSGQFAWSGNSHRRPSLAAKRAAEAVLDDQYWVLPQNVYFFKSNSKPGKDWGRNQYYTSIKGHCFYLYGYKGRYIGDGIPPKLYERTYKYAQYGCKPEERVLRIQQMLNAIGFHVNENSYFDKNTRNALILFQETNGLNADGAATPDTITALIKVYGFENYVGAYVTEQDAA